MNRRHFLKLSVAALPLLGCGAIQDEPLPWWYARAEASRTEWDGLDNPELTVFAGDSIIEKCRWNYPEYWQTRNALNVGIGGLQTRELVNAFGVMGAYKRKFKALYLLSGHHDIDECSGMLGRSLEYRTVRALMFFTAIIDRLRQNNPDMRFHLMNLPPLTAPNDQSAQIYFNAALKEYAEGWQDERILYEDRWAEFIGPDGHMRPELTCDMHHPNREGAMVYMDKYNV